MDFAQNHPALHRFAAPAKTHTALWRLLVGLVLLLCLLILGGMAIGGISLWMGLAENRANAFALFATPISALFLLATFLVWRPALWVTLRILHNRPLRSVFGAENRVDWAAFWRGAGFAALFAIATTLGGIALVGLPEATGVAPHSWALFAVMALPLIYFQTSAEEMVFRGYLLQQLFARFGAFWAWALLPSVFFGLLHWNPTGYAATVWMVLVITGLTGLIFALVTAATGNLGLAMGLHFGFNVYALLLIAPNEAFGALALAHWPEGEGDLALLLALDFSALVVLGVAAAVMHRRSQAAD